MKKLFQLTTGLNIIIVIILANAALSFFPTLRIDLSRDKIHSLSKASSDTVRNLDDIINVKVFMTSDLPVEAKPLADNMKTILTELENINSSRFKVSYVDPLKNEEAKAEASQLGIRPLQFSSIKSDKYEVQNGYFGLAMYYGDKREVLPVASDVGNLEYFLISGIKKLTRKEAPAVVVVGQNNEASDGTGYQYFNKYLSDNYEVSFVSLDEDKAINEKAETMVILGDNQAFSDKAVTKIKDWVDQGKGLVVFLSKVTVGEGMRGQIFENKGLEELLKSKGFVVEPKLILDQSSAIASFRTENGIFPTQYPYWVMVRPENMDAKVPAMSGISSIMLPWASPLQLSEGAKELFSSSEYSVGDDSIDDLSPLSKKNFDKDRLSKNALAAINTNDKNKIVVIGNGSFITDQFVSYNQQNLALGLNLVDYFSQDSTLLTIRSKVIKDSPLKIVEDGTKTVIKVLNIGMPVVLLIAVGIGYQFYYKKQNNRWYEKVNS